MSKVLDEFILYVKSRDGVWFGRCNDIAEYWLANDKA
jgi:hypothetical protein